jgi:hypothetical protein
MSWFAGAKKLELQPESNTQPSITPDQFILHSLAAPWTAQRTYEYWRDSTNLESHFAVGYGGDLAQFIGTQTRADANASANRRANGHGAVSLESASDLKASDKWTDAQVNQIVAVGVWLHKEHGIPLRICRTWDDPGYGHHRMFSEWNPNGHSCPGDARAAQFKSVIFPRIVAGASPPPSTVRTMRDSTSPADIPVNGTQLAAGYVNGPYAWPAGGWGRFPAARPVRIDVLGTAPGADVLDVEPRRVSVPDGVRWLPKALAVPGRSDLPVIYCNRTDRATFTTAAKAAGFTPGAHFNWWVATLDGTRTVADMNHVVAVQYAGTTQTGGHYDESLVYDAAWKADDVPVTDAEMNKIADKVAAKLIAGGGVLENSDVDRIVKAVLNTDGIIPAPSGTDPTNPYWALASYLRTTYELLARVQTALAGVATQASTNGSGISGLQQSLAQLAVLTGEVENAVKLPQGFIDQLSAELAKYSLQITKAV